MTDSLYLAWQYMKFNRGRSLIIIACITIIVTLPLSLEILLAESQRQLGMRAESSPLLLGAKGSSLDLVMNSLYFASETPETITMQAMEEVLETGYASPVPLYIRFRAREFPIVGTSLDYFDVRDLSLDRGELFSMLGNCVIGSQVAKKLGLEPGDGLMSSPETLFDIAGVYPLKMRVTGILKAAGSADDNAVFVDIKTAWVIQGLGHGHEDVTRTDDSTVILKRDKRNVTANAKLMHYAEITEANIDSFHLHGDPVRFPLTAVLAYPNNEKAMALLLGRYVESGLSLQMIRPSEVVEDLMINIFRIRNVLDAVIILVGFATVLSLMLVFSLSLRLREKEVETIFRLGCSRPTIFRILTCEILLILVGTAVTSSVLLAVIAYYDQGLVRSLFI